ncbi:hypothetical protein M436DRAFT_34876 [Aureobasidium namibiae CBS 147.97]|uniref:Arrestin-like N-terminal domain-containing protein n=1 Tax=Aureobasidium namibiae CBS 147.97 TaxID=1043004 RepID=A0A074X1M5_9PEZI|nr:uncharacterized protein M436DRAFT_34876 [Aureobasidium namibiae CBS 147.97]KEQ77639.1 hypothetical protein M436DRAFT_34876 [Aureobasidium namibiae CBS 147.97]
MLASIVLDQTFPHYTNLDYISGKVFVRTQTATTVSAIVVKLEGESRTRLLPPPNPSNDRQKPQLEFHKILYKTIAVFPPPEIVGQQGSSGSLSGKTAYTLPAGQHEYPFSFKFPFNNACDPASNSNPTISLFGGLNVEMYKSPHSHVKKTLPPTLVGFPGEAEIRYYVKATINRPSLFKENVRAYVPFNFCPIEPPRPPPSDALGFARRRHQFNMNMPPTPAVIPSKSKMASFFGGSKKNNGSTSGSTTPTAPFIAVDIRLPEPAILTCAKPVPARLVVTSLNGKVTAMTLTSLQLEVVAITKIRAQDVGRVERSSTVLFSRSGMAIPLQFGDSVAREAIAPNGGGVESEAEIDSRYWSDTPLPNAIPPSFETCNITRSYEIFARIGIRYDGTAADFCKPQTTTIDLRLPVQIFSGITPPPELLEAMSRAQAQAPPLPARKPVASSLAPVETVQIPVQPVQHVEHSGEEPPFGDAPPSYEDAMATDVQPAGGIQRAEYVPPVTAEDPLLNSGRGEKSGWH